jgi:hypothetical protein
VFKINYKVDKRGKELSTWSKLSDYLLIEMLKVNKILVLL